MIAGNAPVAVKPQPAITGNPPHLVIDDPFPFVLVRIAGGRFRMGDTQDIAACKPRELAVKTRNRLARQTLLIARRAYETGGITNAPERVAAVKARGLSRRRYRFAVFARAGEPCLACGTPIERIEVGSRRLYLCSTCQPSHQHGDEGDRRNQ